MILTHASLICRYLQTIQTSLVCRRRHYWFVDGQFLVAHWLQTTLVTSGGLNGSVWRMSYGLYWRVHSHSVSMSARCLAWNTPSSDRCIKQVRFSSISHFKIEKSLSTDVVLANTVARPPQNDRKWPNRPGAQSQASSNASQWCAGRWRRAGSGLRRTNSEDRNGPPSYNRRPWETKNAEMWSR